MWYFKKLKQTTKILTILILTLFFLACGQNQREVVESNKEKKDQLQVDTSIIAVIAQDSISANRVFENCKPTSLTNSDLKEIDSLLMLCISKYNLQQEYIYHEIKLKEPEHELRKANFMIDLKLHKRQYVAAKNSQGQKEVWVNCFCGDWNEHSRTIPIFVKDGGNCYFNLKINLTMNKYYDFSVNGDS